MKTKEAVILLLMFGLVGAACQRPASLQVTPPSIPGSGGSISTGNYSVVMGPQGDSRDVTLHFPPAYDGNHRLPLIIVLHGGGGSGEQVERQSEMDSYADEFGFVAAYPNGSGRLEDAFLTWNSGHCCGYALSHNVDDVDFLSALIDSLVSDYAVDPNRIFMTGLSNGAMMTYRAGAELAYKIAGIAPIAGTIGGQIDGSGPQIIPDTPGQPVSVIAFHGKQDTHVLYDGGIGGEQIDAGRADLSVPTSISFWVNADGCNPNPSTETQADGNIIIDTYSGCEAGTEVVLVTIMDGAHAWPGGKAGIGDTPTQDISASEMILQFFLEHPKVPY